MMKTGWSGDPNKETNVLGRMILAMDAYEELTDVRFAPIDDEEEELNELEEGDEDEDDEDLDEEDLDDEDLDDEEGELDDLDDEDLDDEDIDEDEEP
jgi:ribonuclease E